MQLSLGPKKTVKKPLTTKKPLAAFGNDSSDDEPPAPAQTTSKNPKKKKTATSIVNAQLSTFNSLSTATSTAAAEADPSLYAYDTIYDTLKTADRRKAALESADALERKPKYMANLLEAAEIRKRDQLRANEKKLQREREAEGEEFVDKEQFVTEAYRRQQEELLRVEEEEREKEERLKRKSQGMASFHRNMLNRLEERHEGVVSAAAEGAAAEGGVTGIEEEKDVAPETEIERRARELREKGKNVEVNEEGQVVDKTQLLAGGLNVAPSESRGGRVPVEARRTDRSVYRPGDKRRQQEDVRARQSRLIEDQLLQSQKRQLEEEEKGKEELARQAKSRKTETDVLSAKERYLQRKAAAAAEKNKPL